MNAAQNDDEDEYEDEEEELVMVHLSGIIDTEYLKKCDPTNCQVLGIETEQPVLQMDKMCFHGGYEDAVGTNVIFEEQANMVDEKVQNELKYMCHTVRNLDMVRVFFKNENNMQDEEKDVESTEADTFDPDSISEDENNASVDNVPGDANVISFPDVMPDSGGVIQASDEEGLQNSDCVLDIMDTT